jgi:hypothetical protein
MNDSLKDSERAIGTYRYTVSQIVPALTEAAWRDKHDEIVRLLPHIQRDGFVFRYRRAATSASTAPATRNRLCSRGFSESSTESCRRLDRSSPCLSKHKCLKWSSCLNAASSKH